MAAQLLPFDLPIGAVIIVGGIVVLVALALVTPPSWFGRRGRGD